MYYLDENIKDLVRIFDQNERKDYLRLEWSGCIKHWNNICILQSDR